MDYMKLDIQLFADGKVVIDTELNTKNFEQGLNKIQSTSQKAGSTIKNIVVGLGITKLIGSAMGQISASIDDAVTRLDTLNNFPKVMSNLGIASEDAQQSIDKMSDKLAGLPTTLDQGAMAVQRFASKNSDVAKSTDLFLALNNAILAGGASSEIQSSALEQLSQAYAKGKPDMMEWRTAMMAMPAQLKQVAVAMGYVDADALGEALRNGTVSMDDFMNKIVEMNETGVEGFKSFEEQARNSTGGLATAITVAKTQVVKGVTDVIEALNIKGEELGIGNLASIISGAGKGAKVALDMIAKLIKGEITAFDLGDSIGKMINDFLTKINENAPKIIEVGFKMITDLIKGISSNLPSIMKTAVQVILTLVDSILSNIDVVIDTAIELIIALTEGLIEALPILVEKVPAIITKLVEKLTDPEMLGKLVQAAARLITELAIGLIMAIPSLIKGVAKIKLAILQGLGNLGIAVKEIGLNVVKGIWQGISNSLSWIKSKIKSWVGNVVDFFKKVLKIGSPSKLMADQIGKFMAQGVGTGFDDELNSVYNDMQKAIDFENAKLQSNVEMGKVFNMVSSQTPLVVDLSAVVEMDSQKVGRLVAPSVSQTVKTKGGYQ